MNKIILSMTLALLMFVAGCTNNQAVLTPGWLTYENTEIGYQINYPSTWIVEKSGLTNPNQELIISPAVFEPFVNYVSILVDTRASMQVIESAYTLSKAGAAQETKISFNGYEAYKFTSSENPDIVDIYIPHNKKIFLLSSSKYSDSEIATAFGSFKFIDVESDQSSVCSTDNDCKLIYSNCDCEAVASTDPRESLASNKICIWNVCRGKNVTATCNKGQCTRSDLAQVVVKYLISTADKLKFCNGDDMDSAGYKKTITKEISTTTATYDSLAQTVKNIAILSTDGQCQTALSQLDFKVVDDAVFIPSIDGWAGVSIAMCSCKPEVEVNLLRVPGISKVVWE